MDPAIVEMAEGLKKHSEGAGRGWNFKGCEYIQRIKIVFFPMIHFRLFCYLVLQAKIIWGGDQYMNSKKIPKKLNMNVEYFNVWLKISFNIRRCGSHDHNLYALDYKSHRCVYKLPCGGSIYGSPAIDEVLCCICNWCCMLNSDIE